MFELVDRPIRSIRHILCNLLNKLVAVDRGCPSVSPSLLCVVPTFWCVLVVCARFSRAGISFRVWITLRFILQRCSLAATVVGVCVCVFEPIVLLCRRWRRSVLACADELDHPRGFATEIFLTVGESDTVWSVVWKSLDPPPFLLVLLREWTEIKCNGFFYIILMLTL